VNPHGKQYRVVSKDVGLRVNNWDRFKETLLTGAVATSFGFGVSLTFLVVGAIQWVRESLALMRTFSTKVSKRLAASFPGDEMNLIWDLRFAIGIEIVIILLYLESPKFSRHARLDPASRTFNLSKRHWIPAFAGMTAWNLCIQ